MDSRAKWKKFLREDHSSSTDAREMVYGIYDLESSTSTVEGYEHIERNDSLMRLIAQGKFASGILVWSKEEMAALKQWLSSVTNVTHLRNIYRSIILSYRNKSYVDYAYSEVATVLGD